MGPPWACQQQEPVHLLAFRSGWLDIKEAQHVARVSIYTAVPSRTTLQPTLCAERIQSLRPLLCLPRRKGVLGTHGLLTSLRLQGRPPQQPLKYALPAQSTTPHRFIPVMPFLQAGSFLILPTYSAIGSVTPYLGLQGRPPPGSPQCVLPAQSAAASPPPQPTQQT